MSWRWLRNYRLPISFIAFVAGLYFGITSGYWVVQRAGLISKNASFEYLTAWANAWNWWLLILGVILIFAGGWYFWDTLRKMREFEEYMESESRKKFKENIRELEEIAYKLGDRYMERLEEKKREWRIK